MMAAYWKSPYKEPSNFSGRGPHTSTGRFEQSLSLTRAKSSILTSGHDIFGWHLPQTKRPGSSQQHQKQSNGNLKGILKTPRGRLSPRLRVRTDESNNADSSADKKSNPQRPTKRVSFGPCDEAVDDDSEYSGSNFRGFRAHYITLQRLNHSRKVEESAMQKLNKLISGVSMKGSTQTTAGSKTSSTCNPSPLPVVDGKGLLTPRSDSDKSKSTCKHSSDLKCAGCFKKDVETGEVETKTTETESQQNDTANDSKPVFGPGSDTNAEEDDAKSGAVGSTTGTVKVPLSVTLFDDMSPRLNPEKSLGKRRISHNKPKPVSFQNKKFQSKLLPGRYPFNTGALHTRHVGAKKTNPEKTKPNATDKTDVTALSREQTIDATETENQQPSPESTQTNSQTTETSDGNQRPVPVIKSRGESRERRSMDKTSQILTWLKDVRQKQNFKPRNARFVVLESQPTQ